MFEYRVECVSDQSDKSMWFLLFFDYALWWGTTWIWEDPSFKANN